MLNFLLQGLSSVSRQQPTVVPLPVVVIALAIVLIGVLCTIIHSRARMPDEVRSAATHHTVGMPLQTLHFAYALDERAFLSERPFYKGKPRLKVRLIPESRYQAADIYFCGGLDSAPLCENWSEIAQK